MKSFKKVFFVCFVVFFIIFVLLGGVLFFLLRNFDPNKFKPQIIAQAEQALGRKVEAGNIQIGLSIKQGLFVGASGIKIADDLQFSKENFLIIDKVSLGLDLLSLVTRRQVNISTVEILAPKVFFVRNEEGGFNFQTLKVLQQNAEGNSDKMGPSSPSAGQASSAAVAAILIQNVIVKDGLFSFKDYLDEEKSLVVKKIDLNLTDFSLAHPFKVSVKASIFSDKQDVNFLSTANIDLPSASLVLKNAQARFDASLVDVRRLNDLIPSIVQAKLQNPLGGQLDVAVGEARINAQGFSVKKLQGQVSGGEIKTAYLKTPIKDISSKFDMNEHMFNIDAASCQVGSGRIDLNGVIANYLTSQDYTFTLKSSELNVAEILDQSGRDIELEGLASINVDVKGKGLSEIATSGPESGKATLRFKEGKLRNMNILKVVLDKISMIPDLVGTLEQNLPEEYKKKLGEQDTEIKAVNFDMNIDQGNLNINSAEVQADVFSLQGKGVMDIHLNTQMQAHISIPQDLSKSMIASSKQLKFIADTQGQIVIPLTISGKIPDKLSYLPDLEYLGRQLLETQGREALGSFLNKVLKRNDESGQAGTASGSGSSDGSKDSSGEIINNVLDAIFK